MTKDSFYQLIPLSLLAPAVLGGVLVWACFVARTRRRQLGSDILLNIVEIVGWLLSVGSVLGLFFVVTGLIMLVPMTVAFFAAILVARRFRDSEQRALTALLAIAVERGIPLGMAVRCFAEEHQGLGNPRLQYLADLLDSGMSLPHASRRARVRFGPETTLAMRLGCRAVNLGPALQQSLHRMASTDALRSGLFERLLYLLVLVLFVSLGVLFWEGTIFPLIEELHTEFGTNPTPFGAVAFRWLGSQALFDFLTPLLVLMLFVCVLLCLGYYLEWISWYPPLFRRVWFPWDSANVLSAMGTLVKSGYSVATILKWLSADYPRRAIRRRLVRAARYVERGQAWSRSLQQTGFIHLGEAAVLEAAERAGNVPWALEEMADRVLRRGNVRIQRMFDLFFPLAMLLLSLLILCLALMQLLPVFQLITDGVSLI